MADSQRYCLPHSVNGCLGAYGVHFTRYTQVCRTFFAVFLHCHGRITYGKQPILICRLLFLAIELKLSVGFARSCILSLRPMLGDLTHFVVNEWVEYNHSIKSWAVIPLVSSKFRQLLTCWHIDNSTVCWVDSALSLCFSSSSSAFTPKRRINVRGGHFHVHEFFHKLS